jgi:cytochrome c5
MAEENEVLSTDEEILASIDESMKATGDAGDIDDEPSEAPTESETSSEPSAPVDEAEDVESEAGADSTEQQPRGPQDIVDQSGTVIATGGRERRFYETAQRERQGREAAEGKLKEAEAKLQGVEAAGSIGTQLNLTNEEVVAGARIMAAYKQSPADTIKYMLTQAEASGHNIQDIGSGTDLAAIKQMLDTQLAPFREEREAKEAEAATAAEADRIYNDFVVKYPDGVIHGDTLAQLIEKEPDLTPDAAYFKLKSFYAERGLDFSKTLQQLQEEIDAAPEEIQPSQPSLPSGRQSAGSATPTDEIVSADTTFDEIIRMAMSESRAG